MRRFDIQSGFALIELLIVITIIVLLMGLSLAGYTRFNSRQTLYSAGKTVVLILRDAQSRAYTGEKDCSLCSCAPNSQSPLIGWTVDFTSNSISGACGSVSSPTVFPTIPFSRYPLPPQTSYTLSAGTSIQFIPIPPQANISTNVTINVKYANYLSTFYKIIVEPSGNIDDLGLQ